MIVYRYGALKPTQGFEAVLSQLRLACRYRNALVELLNWRIIAEQRGAAAREVLKQMGASEGLIQALADFDRAAIRTTHAEMSRWLRSRCALGWGTYQAIEADIKRAAKSPYKAPKKGSGRARWFAMVRELGLDPTKFRARFRRFDGTGRLGATVQACSNISTDHVLSEKGPFQMNAPEGRTAATLNLGLDNIVKLPVVAHRKLPPGAHVVRVILCVERVGTRYVYSLHVTMRYINPERHFGEGLAAINFGWRSLGDQGVRVAYVATDSGEKEQLVLPRRLIDKLRHAESLRSLGDDAAVAYLGDAKQRSRRRREILQDPASTNRELGKIRIEGEPLSPEHWARRDRHLYQWERDEYAKVLRQRQEIYRLWVRGIAKKYGSVRVEDYDLPTLIDRDKPVEIPEARHVRFLVAPGYLRAEVKSVFGERCELVEIKKRTTVCSVCGEDLVGDRARDIELWCERCGAEKDQDANNAQNQVLEPAAE